MTSELRCNVLTDTLPYENVCDHIVVFRVVTGDRPPHRRTRYET